MVYKLSMNILFFLDVDEIERGQHQQILFLAAVGCTGL